MPPAPSSGGAKGYWWKDAPLVCLFMKGELMIGQIVKTTANRWTAYDQDSAWLGSSNNREEARLFVSGSKERQW